MPLLIDGYNLLYSTGIAGRGEGPGSLERSRLALLNFLAESLAPKDLPHTTVVFDAHEAPSGLPRSLIHRGIRVQFASTHESADALIEELIRADFAPHRLTVVSSDHEIQRAAHRRRAKAIDSDAWYAALLRSRQSRRRAAATTPATPAVPLLAEDVNYWMRQFGGESVLLELLERESNAMQGDASVRPPTERTPAANSANLGNSGPSAEPSARATKNARAVKKAAKATTPRKKASKRRRGAEGSPSDKPRASGFESLDNPFPPGYGDDLLGGLE